MYNPAFRKIEYYLYSYEFIDMHIEDLKMDISDLDYNQNYTRYIKNKSSSLENQVIQNINLESRILKIRRWQDLITSILKKYEQTNILYYRFIDLKYFRKDSYLKIQEKLNLSLKKQKDIRDEILQYIFFVARKNNMLREVK